MKVFFYGLFMDTDVLFKKGIHPPNPRKGHLNNYALKIGQRASLIPWKNERAYGVIMEVDKTDLSKLYTEKSVADYLPEEVEVVTESNERIKATCYNLPPGLLGGTNESYANSLYELAKELNFPEEYLIKIIAQKKNPSK